MAKSRKSRISAEPQPERKGPYLSAALIAEKVLTEKDALTFVRVIDIVSIRPDVLMAGLKAGIEKERKQQLFECPLTIAVTFKAGGYKGKSSVLIVQGSPSGRSEPLGAAEVVFDGSPGRSYTVQCPVRIFWEHNGFYWFDIMLDNKFITRIPLEANIIASDALPTPLAVEEKGKQ